MTASTVRRPIAFPDEPAPDWLEDRIQSDPAFSRTIPELPPFLQDRDVDPQSAEPCIACGAPDPAHDPGCPVDHHRRPISTPTLLVDAIYLAFIAPCPICELGLVDHEPAVHDPEFCSIGTGRTLKGRRMGLAGRLDAADRARQAIA